jgi:hypothetical protein
VKTVIFGRDLSRADGILHTSSRSHRVFPSDTNTIEEEGPGVADNPSVLGNTPGGSEHDETNKHDDGVLDETEATAEPVTNDTDKNLTDDDTTNLQVVNSLKPCLIADLGLSPASRESSLEKGPDVANGKEDVTR